MCYLEFGHQDVVRAEVTFASEQQPVGNFEAPQGTLADEKAGPGASRTQRSLEWAWTEVPRES